jgi:alkaline phosphatase D
MAHQNHHQISPTRAEREMMLRAFLRAIAADGHGFERWGNLPRERERLYRLLAAAGDTPTILISGDRHFAALYRAPLGHGRSLLEATSSSLNRPWTDAAEADPNQIGPVYGNENFGTIEIDWPARRATVAIRDIDGNPVREETVDLGD